MTHQLSSTLFKVLDTLNDCELHQGNEIASTLGISRTAVWKVIQRLKKYNINIQTQHQGYRIAAPLILFQKKKIEDQLKNQKIDLEVFETLASTSDYLKNKKPMMKPTLCIAEYQTQGRGRLGRHWISPFGRNIYCSVSYIFNKDVSALSGLSLVVGMLTAQVLESLNGNLMPMLKWPNDIYLNDKKAGGILIELLAEANGNCMAVISIGLNVNMKNEQLPIDKPWTSLEHALSQQLDRNVIVAKLIEALLDGMEIYSQEGLKPFLGHWEKYDYLANKRVSVQVGKSQSTGIAKGVDEHGFLILELSQGIQKKFSSGDTSICDFG